MKTERGLMTGLDVVKLVNDKVLEFGNDRFLEGWNGAVEQLVKLLDADQHLWRERVTYDALIATIKGLQKGSQGWATNPHYPSAHFTVFDDFDRKVFKLTATEWEKLNMELDKD